MKLQHLTKNKKLVLALIGSAGILAAAYIVWSSVVWGGYDKNTSIWREGVKKEAVQAIAMASSSKEERSKKLAAIDALTHRVISERQKACAAPHGLVAWQTLIPTLDEKVRACESLLGKVVTFSARMDDFSAFQKESDEYVKGIAPLIAVAPLAEKSWAAKSSAWQKHLGSLQAWKVDEVFEPVRKVAVTQEQAVVAAWKALIAAHGAKNEASFNSAKGKLNTAYAGLTNITSAAAKELKTLSQRVQQAYEAAR